MLVKGALVLLGAKPSFEPGLANCHVDTSTWHSVIHDLLRVAISPINAPAANA